MERIKFVFRNLLFFCASIFIWRLIYYSPLWDSSTLQLFIIAGIGIIALTFYKNSISILSAIIVLWISSTGFYPLTNYMYIILMIYVVLVIYFKNWSSAIALFLLVGNSFLIEVKTANEILNVPILAKSIDINNTAYEVMSRKVLESNIKCDKEMFLSELQRICNRHHINPVHLLFVMWAESDINPSAINPNGNATGLIQFMPSTSKSLGIAHSKLKYMDGIEQLKAVDLYLRQFDGQFEKCSDISIFYLIFFYPAAIDKIADNNEYRFPNNVVIQNKTIFHGNNDYATFKRYVKKRALTAGI